MPFMDDDDGFDRDYDRPVRHQEECPNCGEYYGEGTGAIRECADCAIQGCYNCVFEYDDDDLCDDCIDELSCEYPIDPDADPDMVN